MELIYRGVHYTVDPIQADVVDAPIVGHYRGGTFHLHQIATVPMLSRMMHLMYRGIGFYETIGTPIA